MGVARRPSGFTLIELMIVIAIVGILASAAIPAFLRYMEKARSVEGLHNLAKITDAATGYYEAHSQFPANFYWGGTFWEAFDTDAPWTGWGQYCQSGVFPEIAVKDFNQPWNQAVWNGLMFQPEGNIRFRYSFEASGDKASGTLWGGTWAIRYVTCGPPTWKYYAYEYEAKVDAKKNLTFHGPRTWGNVAAP